ncbi:MAG: MFS transporter [Caulobacteraceae bacterium]|nr:MFS transporter [Caulobacteraceae bacterium]
MIDPPEPAAPRDATAASWHGLAVLTLITLFALVDRRVFVLLAEPIKHDLALSDLQLGLLQGIGLAMFAIVVTYPIGWLADRYDRRYILAGCISVWCLAVISCGFAHGFGQLFVTSAVVGAGEAGLTPIAFAIIPLLFYGPRRQLANSVYTIFTTLSVGLAIALCGYLIAFVDIVRPFLPGSLRHLESWRLSFMAAGLPGPIFAALLLSVRLPTERTVPVKSINPAPSVDDVSLYVFVRRNWLTVGSFFLGLGFAVMGFAAITTWLPIAAMRQFAATPIEVGNDFAAVIVITAIIGLVFTGFGAPILARRFGVVMPILVLTIATFGAAGAIVFILRATDTRWLFILYGLHAMFAAAGSMLYPTALQDISPSHLRARMASLNLVVTFSFSALGPALVGLASDLMPHHPGSIMMAIVAVGVSGLLVSGVLLLICCRHYPATLSAVRLGSRATPSAL